MFSQVCVSHSVQGEVHDPMSFLGGGYFWSHVLSGVEISGNRSFLGRYILGVVKSRAWVCPEGGGYVQRDGYVQGWLCPGGVGGYVQGVGIPADGTRGGGNIRQVGYAFYLTAFLFCFLSLPPPEKLSNLVNIYYLSSDLSMTTQDCFVQGRQLADTTKFWVYYSWQPWSLSR